MKKIALALILAFAVPALAAVPSTVSRVDTTGNGSATAFTFTFPVTTSAAHVEVYLAGVKQVSGYTVALNANQTSSPGGTVTFTSAPANGAAVRIQRTVPLTQDTVYTTAVPPKTTEKALDRLEYQVQQVERTRQDKDDEHDAEIGALAVGSPANAGDALVTSSGSTTARALKDRAADVVNVKDFGAVGDGITDDTAAIQAAIDAAGAGGTVLFPKTATNLYPVSAALKFYNAQTWQGSGGADVLGTGTELRLTASSTSVAEPNAPTSVTYAPRLIGIYFNAQGFATVAALSLYNTSYALVDQCAANTTADGTAGILLDSDTSRQSYFNKINMPRVFATGTGSVGIRFTRGANANQVFGGKIGSSTRGMEFLSLSAGNLVFGTDFEGNSVDHVYISGSGRNAFYGVHMESAPVGFNIASDASYTRIDGTSYASTVTTQVQDASNTTIRHETYTDDSSALDAGFLRLRQTAFSSASQAFLDPLTVNGTADSLVSLFYGVTTTGARQLRLFASPTVLSVLMDAKTGQVQGKSLAVQDDAGIARSIVFRSASLARWYFQTTATAESGSDAGSDLALLARNDAGNAIDTPISIIRAQNGAITLSRPLTMSGFRIAHARTAMTYAASMTPQARNADIFAITATDGTAFTVNAPAVPATGQRITIQIRNSSGGALGAATWDSVFKMAAWTQPADGQSRAIDFVYDGTNWVEVSRTPADVPN